MCFTITDQSLWEYHPDDPYYVELLKLKWRTYRVEFHPEEVRKQISVGLCWICFLQVRCQSVGYVDP